MASNLSYAFDSSQGQTPESIARRRQTADLLAARMFSSTPRNVGEGIGLIGQALMLRQMQNEASDAQKAGQANAVTPEQLAALSSGGMPTGLPPTPASSFAGSSFPAAAPDVSGKIYSNDEPSPLDPPSGQDLRNMQRGIIGEAGNEPALGQNAVASVIRTRAVDGGYGGDTPTNVLTAPNQFEPFNTQAGRDRMDRGLNDPKQLAAANDAIDRAYGTGNYVNAGPNDPTEGMTHFFSPAGQTALGRKPPAWAGGDSVTIGGHVFNSPDDATGSSPVKVASNGAMAFNGEPAQNAPTTSLPRSNNYGGPFPNATNDFLTQQMINQWNPKEMRAAFSAERDRRIALDAQNADPMRQLDMRYKQSLIDKATHEGANPEYGLNPIYGTDQATGEQVLGVLGKDGSFKKIDTGGVKIQSGVDKIDLGTHFQIRDKRTGAVIGVEPKDLKGAAAQESLGKAQGSMQATLPGDLQNAQSTVTQIDQLIKHPGLSSIVGPMDQFRPSWMLGSEGRDALARYNQLKGKSFLQAYSTLRGGGAITEVEGQKAQDAIARMDRAQGEDDFTTALQDFRDAVKTGSDKLREKAGVAAAPANAPPTGKTSSGIFWSVE